MSVMVVTTISCDAVILHCQSCQADAAGAYAVSSEACRMCGGTLLFERRCGTGFSLHKDSILIRCIAENKDGWRCEDRGGRDFCPTHIHLANPARISQRTPRAIGET